jgi:hypothetical protein
VDGGRADEPGARACDRRGRWYPTLVTQAEGTVLAVSGHPREDDSRHNNDSPEAWSASPRDAGTWRLVTGADPAHAMDYYPRVHVLPDGTLFFATRDQFVTARMFPSGSLNHAA